VIFKFNVIEVVESPVVEVYSVAAVQPRVLAPYTLEIVPVPYEPEPDAGEAHVKLLAVAVSANTAATPGVADFGVAKEVAGAVITRAPTVIVSPIAKPAGSWNVTGIVAVVLEAAETGVPNVMSDGVRGAALEGATDRTPRPNAATATSAMRLKVVFVDICFLSISRTEEFPQFGLNQISLVRFDESHVLIHQIPRPISGRSEGISI